MALHFRERDALPHNIAVPHRYPASLLLRAEHGRGVGFDLLHHERSLLRAVHQGYPLLVGQRAAARDRPAHGKDLSLRLLQATTRDELGGRGFLDPYSYDTGVHRLRSALGHGGLLRLGGRHEDSLLHAADRGLDVNVSAGWGHGGTGYPLAGVRHPRVAVASGAGSPDRSPPVPASQTR